MFFQTLNVSFCSVIDDIAAVFPVAGPRHVGGMGGDSSDALALKNRCTTRLSGGERHRACPAAMTIAAAVGAHPCVVLRFGGEYTVKRERVAVGIGHKTFIDVVRRFRAGGRIVNLPSGLIAAVRPADVR